MARTAFSLLAFSLVLGVNLMTSVQAASPPAQSLLPTTTKGFLSIPDVDQLREKWNETQVGQLAKDPLMKPFIDDLRQQIEDRLSRTDARLSIKLDDLDGVYGGEVCLATVQPNGDEKQHALVLLVDVTAHHEQVQKLLKKIDGDLQGRGATSSVEQIRGVSVKTYVLPRRSGEPESRFASYFVHGDTLLATDHKGTAKLVLDRLLDGNGKALGSLPAFTVALERCEQASGDVQPHVRWFVEPFGYIQAVRASSGGRQRRGTDMLKVLANQGFTAVQGVGGMLTFSTAGHEVFHRTFVYAPSNGTSATKYRLAARMLDFPNVKELSPQIWVPHVVSNYLTFRWKMQDAFEYSKSLVDEMAGAPVFDDILDSLKNDPHGPRVDLRAGLIKHLGERATFFTDYRKPVTITSERWLMALEVNAPVTVAQTLEKAMRADPDVTKRVIGKHVVWEIVENSVPAEVEDLDIAGPGFGDFGMEEQEEEEEEEDLGPLLSHAAFTVANDHLLVASHIDYMEEILARGTGNVALDQTKDHTRVDNALAGLGAGTNSFRFFTRTDKALHTTYELMRQGKMPESESLFGNLLNRLLGPEEEGVLREQQLKGDQLPDFDKVSGYLGPAGAYVSSLDDGWLVVGCVLKKLGNGMQAAGPIVSRRIHDLR